MIKVSSSRKADECDNSCLSDADFDGLISPGVTRSRRTAVDVTPEDAVIYMTAILILARLGVSRLGYK